MTDATTKWSAITGIIVLLIAAGTGLFIAGLFNKDMDGEAWPSNPLLLRLESIASKAGGEPVNCGVAKGRNVRSNLLSCVNDAFASHNPFFVRYLHDAAWFQSGYGVAGDSSGSVSIVTFDSRGYPPVVPRKRIQLTDDNRMRVISCLPPVTLTVAETGEVGCVLPVNEKASNEARNQTTVDTTLCAIAQDPSAFNNRLVRIRGSVSGNFEYSLIEDENCRAVFWFGYGGNEALPGLVAHVGGSGVPGAEDADGRYIRPIPVTLVRDEKFARFQELMKLRAEQVNQCTRKGDFNTDYSVSATMVGRIDAVSAAIHNYRKSLPEMHRSDFLGFGHMGLFEAQFILQSVVDGAVLNKEKRPIQ